MRTTQSRMQLVGFVLNLLIAGMMIVLGFPKLLGMAPPEHIAKMGLTESIRIVGAGEIITGILLLIPRTLSLGVLLASSFWGGAICVHMTHGESYVFQSGILIATWIGAYLRNPTVLGSIRGPELNAAPAGIGRRVGDSSSAYR